MDSIKDLEKYDLHCHLDGSLSVTTIQKLAGEIGLVLPEAEQLAVLTQVQRDCKSLSHYLKKFEIPLKCLVTRESFRISVLDILKEASEENVKYMEIRFSPLSSAHESLSCKDIIESALAGTDAGKELYDVDSRLIICAMRHVEPERNVELVRTAREYLGDGICALDLAGDENSFPAKLHRSVFREATKLEMPFTIHAGECGSAESVWDALELGASRIGHGIAIQKDERLKKHCAKARIPLEMCPTSNLQTKAVDSIESYPFLSFLEAGIPVTVNTDNRNVSNTTITKELELLKSYYKLTNEDIKQLIKNGAEAAFINL